MNSAGIAHALNGRPNGSGWMCRCPAHDDRTPSLSIKDGDNGKLVLNCFAGCTYQEIMSALCREGLIENINYSYKPSLLKQPKILSQEPKPLDWSDNAEYIWRKAVPLIETPAQLYLRTRGCAIPNCNDLKFLPANGKYFPAMLARLTDAITAKPISLHFTNILPDGSGKAPIEPEKRFLGGHRKLGGVFRLIVDSEVTMGLGISEGIETALSIMQSGWRPIWAAGDAGNIETFPVLQAIESLTIFADNDINEKGIIAANKCKKRWLGAGCNVRITMPKRADSDWNDVGGQANEQRT